MAYIDAEKIKRHIRVNLMPNVDVDGTITVENAERYFLNLIDKTSTADVTEVKHGGWVDAYISGVHHYRCTNCGEYIEAIWTANFDYSYCPNCGALMNGGKEE